MYHVACCLILNGRCGKFILVPGTHFCGSLPLWTGGNYREAKAKVNKCPGHKSDRRGWGAVRKGSTVFVKQ